jgi:fructose-1,6-bisphosphatase/inositol monophosphatase family enzyme
MEHMEDVNGVVWVVDPIDGTLNFVHQQEGFAISIGIYRDTIDVFHMMSMSFLTNDAMIRIAS